MIFSYDKDDIFAKPAKRERAKTEKQIAKQVETEEQDAEWQLFLKKQQEEVDELFKNIA